MKPRITLTLLLLQVCLALDGDPYKILGVSRRASQSDIKAAYKQLAKKWHPDKNDSPQAEQKFVEMTEAYNVLNDKEQREHYDRFGTVKKEGQGRGGGFDPFGGGGGFHGFHGSSFFEEFGFRMPEPFPLYEKFKVNRDEFNRRILPSSYERPYLVLVYSNICFTCRQMQPIWEQVVNDLEPLGYGVATVNNMQQRRLVADLGARRLPDIFVIVQGRIKRYRQHDISQQFITKFAKQAVPPHLIQAVTDDNYDYFLDAWRSNKISVLFFGSLESPRLRSLLLAYKYQEFASFGYVRYGYKDVGLRERYKLPHSSNVEWMLIFHEDTSTPVATVSAHGQLSSSAMERSIEEHKFLTLPRISSQRHFDGICPPDRRSLCAVLLASRGVLGLTDPDADHINAFREYAQHTLLRSTHGTPLRYAFMFKNAQVDFVRSLSSTPPTLTDHALKNGSYRDVVLLKRLDGVQMRYAWLRGAFSGDALLVNSSYENLEKQLRQYLQRGDALLSLSTHISWDLYNENGPTLYRRLVYAIISAYETIMYYAYQEEFSLLFTILGSFLLVILFGRVMSFLSNYDPAAGQYADGSQARTNRPMPSARAEQSAEFTKLGRELRLESYNSLVRDLKPGCRSIVVIADDESKEQLLKQFRRTVWPWRKNAMVQFGYLIVPKNITWFKHLLVEVLGGDEERVASVNYKNVLGTVLIINGFRQYFQIYHAKHQSTRAKASAVAKSLSLDDDDVSTTSDEEEDVNVDDAEASPLLRQRRRPTTESTCVNSPSRPESTSSSHSQDTVFVSELLSELPGWLERVFDGQVQRYYVSEWPAIR